MIRELFTRKDTEHGFALPTVMIVSVVMMIILVTAVQASASVRTALSNQYYNNLAAEAAEAGIMFAHACIQNKDGYASWNQLQPDTDCNGNGINGLPKGRYLIKNDGEMRTTFNVSSTTLAESNISDPYDLTVTGSVQLLRKSSPTNPWKTITVKKKLKVQPCTKTITNLISNPSFENDASGWNGYNANIGITGNAAGPPGDGIRTLLVQSGGSNDSFAEPSPSSTGLQPGKTYTVSGVVHTPAPTNYWNNDTDFETRRLSIGVFAYQPTLGTYYETYARSESTNPGSRRVTNTFTIPSGAGTPFLRLYNGGVSKDVYWDSIMLTEGTVDYQYRDGDTPGWAWNGTHNNTTSSGPVRGACTAASTCTPTNMITNPNFEIPSTVPGTIPTGTEGGNTWEASNATIGRESLTPLNKPTSNFLKITPSTTYGDSFASIGGDNGAIRLGMQPGKTYTASATVHVPTNLSGTVYVPQRRAGIVIHTYTAGSGYVFYTATPNGNYQYYQAIEPLNSYSYVAAGTYKLKTTFTIPTVATIAFLRLYNGGTTNGQNTPIYWDNVALYEGTGASYYDGDSPGWSWSGDRHLSTSSGPVVPCNAPISY